MTADCSPRSFALLNQVFPYSSHPRVGVRILLQCDAQNPVLHILSNKPVFRYCLWALLGRLRITGNVPGAARDLCLKCTLASPSTCPKSQPKAQRNMKLGKRMQTW